MDDMNIGAGLIDGGMHGALDGRFAVSLQAGSGQKSKHTDVIAFMSA
jgi:hypothetical protein